NSDRAVEPEDFLRYRIFDSRAVSVVDVPREVLLAHHGQERLSDRRFEKRDVVELELVEKGHLPRLRMPDDRRRSLPGSQSALRPFEFGSRLRADLLDALPIVGSVKALPTHVEALGVVADVEQPLFRKPLPQDRIESSVNGATIDDRRLPSALRGKET